MLQVRLSVGRKSYQILCGVREKREALPYRPGGAEAVVNGIMDVAIARIFRQGLVDLSMVGQCLFVGSEMATYLGNECTSIAIVVVWDREALFEVVGAQYGAQNADIEVGALCPEAEHVRLRGHFYLVEPFDEVRKYLLQRIAIAREHFGLYLFRLFSPPLHGRW